MERILRKLASKSDHEHYRHSCIVVRGSNIIAQGFNKKFKHAEVSAIGVKHLRRPNYFRGSRLYSFRFNKTGFGNSRPCNNCEHLIREVGIKSMIYWHDGNLITENL